MKIAKIAAVAAFAAATADAALVSYDVGDYVQDGLVTQFDAIRNVGANLPHNPSAAVWKNLAGGPDFVISNESPHAMSEYWMEDGLLFMTNVWAKFDRGQDVTTNFSVQMACDVGVDVASRGRGAQTDPLYPAILTTWDTLHTCTFFTRYNSEGNAWLEVRNERVSSESTTGTDHCRLWGWDGKGYTMVMDDDATYLFSGDARSSGVNVARSRWRMELGRPWAIGRTVEPGDRDGLRGIVRAIRFYNRALSDAETAQNNAIDRFRFRGERAATNVIVATSRPGLNGAESGNCQVDGSHVFTAPAVCTNATGSAVYACGGYALETWDGSAWSAPVTNAGATAYSYDVSTSPAKVRLTWLWTQTGGVVMPEPCDYVQDGLVLQYDAICNDGAGRPHRDRPLFANLVDPYNPLYMIHVGEATGSWSGNAYRLRGNTFGEMAGTVDLGGAVTVETAVDCSEAAQVSRYRYVFGPADDSFSLFMNSDNWQLKAKYLSATRPYLPRNSWNGRYFAAAVENHTAWLTDGVTWPDRSASTGTKETVGNIHLMVSAGDAATTPVTNYPSVLALVGDLHSFRIYDRRLTEAELAQNRAIDDWRFHGAVPVTNVIVASLSPAEAAHAADGAYQVMSSHVFRAPCARAETPDGRVYLIDGCRVDRYNAASGDWTAIGRYAGDAYEYRTEDGTVRLTWLWKRGGGIVTYDADDYIRSGLAVNFDAIRNAGAGEPHDNNASVWTDCAGSGLTIGFTLPETTQSGWRDDRFRCARDALGEFSGELFLPESSTIQLVLSDTSFDNTMAYPTYFARTDDVISFYTRTASQRKVEWKHHGSQSPRKMLTDWQGLYLDAIMNENSFYLSQDTTRGTAQAKNFTSSFRNNSHLFDIGAENSKDLAKTYADCSYHAVRVYHHALLEWELAFNRAIDEARFRGAPPVTNVVVAVAKPSLGFEGTEPCGVYQVGESHVFTASPKTADGNVWRVKGYTLEAWDSSLGAWGAPAFVRSSAYAWESGVSPDKVRITWSWGHGMVMFVR